MKKYVSGLLVLLLAVCFCAGALAETGVHPYQYGAPEWVKELAAQSGPKGFSVRVKETYGEAQGEKMLESLIPQKGPVKAPEEPSPVVAPEPLDSVYESYRAMLQGHWDSVSDVTKVALGVTTFDEYYARGLEIAQNFLDRFPGHGFSSLEESLLDDIQGGRMPEGYGTSFW